MHTSMVTIIYVSFNRVVIDLGKMLSLIGFFGENVSEMLVNRKMPLDISSANNSPL